MIWAAVKRTLGSTFWNNGLAQLVTVLAIFYGANEGLHWWEKRQAANSAEKHIEAIQDRCAADKASEEKSKKEVRDAIKNDPDNDFINQRVRD